MFGFKFPTINLHMKHKATTNTKILGMIKEKRTEVQETFRLPPSASLALEFSVFQYIIPHIFLRFLAVLQQEFNVKMDIAEDFYLYTSHHADSIGD